MACTIITGGGGAIGAAVASVLLGEDPTATCALVDVQFACAESLVDDVGAARVRAYSCDVSDATSTRRAMDRIADWQDDVAGLVAAAGNVAHLSSIDLDGSAWHRVLDVHLDGTLYWCQAVAPWMRARGGGSIVGLSSVVAHFAHPRRLAYTAAKAGVEAMVRTLAVEWASWGIRVNAVAPGYVETDMIRSLVASGAVAPEVIADAHALKRMARPEEIARPIAFLLSDAASFVTGTTLTVDGGFSVTRTTN